MANSAALSLRAVLEWRDHGIDPSSPALRRGLVSQFHVDRRPVRSRPYGASHRRRLSRAGKNDRVTVEIADHSALSGSNWACSG